MLSYSVHDDLERAMRQLRTFSEEAQFKFAVAQALTDTAKDAQMEVQRNMAMRFILRRDWIVKGIRIKPATKADMEAWVYSKDEFMGRQEEGGTKTPKQDKHLAIPYQARTNPRALIPASNLPGNLGKATIEIVNKRGRRTIRGKGGQAFKFEVRGITYLVRRRGKRLEFLYVLQSQARVEPRLGLARDATKIAQSRFMRHLERRFEQALRSAR